MFLFVFPLFVWREENTHAAKKERDAPAPPSRSPSPNPCVRRTRGTRERARQESERAREMDVHTEVRTRQARRRDATRWRRRLPRFSDGLYPPSTRRYITGRLVCADAKQMACASSERPPPQLAHAAALTPSPPLSPLSSSGSPRRPRARASVGGRLCEKVRRPQARGGGAAGQGEEERETKTRPSMRTRKKKKRGVPRRRACLVSVAGCRSRVQDAPAVQWQGSTGGRGA